MSIEVTSRAWKHSQASGARLLLILALADRADEDGVCWPGVNYLAERARITPRQVQRLLVQCEKSGDIYIERRAGRKHTNDYFVAIGLDRLAIQGILMRRFGLTPLEAASVAQKMLEKGDVDVTISQPVEPEKGDIQSKKGDIQGEMVTFSHGKGDIAMSPDSSFNPSVNDPSEDPREGGETPPTLANPSGQSIDGIESAHDPENSAPVEEDLFLASSPQGRVIIAELARAAPQRQARLQRLKYANPQQREAYQAVYCALGEQLPDLVRKGIARNRVSLASLLAWLQACSDRLKQADVPVVDGTAYIQGKYADYIMH